MMPGLVGLLGAGALLVQASTTKTAAPTRRGSGAGKTVFQQKCSVCHYDNSDQKKSAQDKGTFEARHVQREWKPNHGRQPEGVDRERRPVDAAVQDVLEAGQIKDVTRT